MKIFLWTVIVLASLLVLVIINSLLKTFATKEGRELYEQDQASLQYESPEQRRKRLARRKSILNAITEIYESFMDVYIGSNPDLFRIRVLRNLRKRGRR